MDFFEIEGKTLFKKFGIPTKVGFLLTDNTDYDAMQYPCVVKAQVLAGHRGQAGGVKIVHTPQELKQQADRISRLVIGGKPVEALLVCPVLEIVNEFYMGLTLDTVSKRVIMLFTMEGGMEIEDLARKEPEKLVKIDCTNGFRDEDFNAATEALNIDDTIRIQLLDIAQKLCTMYFSLDATTVEINPLILNGKGELEAADSKLVIDDNALFRQEDYTIIPRKERGNDQTEAEAAKQAGLAYVELDPAGDIGLMAGGAGLGMITVDTIKHYGGTAHNFLDLGGGVTADKTYAAMKLLLAIPQIHSILINIFGGINNCDVMSQGIVRAIEETNKKKRVVVKSRGHGQEEGWKRFEKAGCLQVKYGTTDDAVKLLLGGDGE
jgi:succinyl-CoA synthetase beta subunit